MAQRECPPCRGTGTVISGKGGEPHPQPCPWCEGTGVIELPDPAATPSGE